MRNIENDNENRLYKIYYKELKDCKPISREEEVKLIKKYKNNNDINARNKLIRSNLHFVADVAKRYKGLGLSYQDLISEGNLGLIKAIDRFDYTKDFKLITYGVHWIKQGILEALNKRNNSNHNELHDNIIDDRDDDDVYVSNEYELFQNKEYVKEIMSVLTRKERNIIDLYFGFTVNEPLTLEEIGEIYNISKERVRIIKEKALTKMRSKCLILENNNYLYR